MKKTILITVLFIMVITVTFFSACSNQKAGFSGTEIKLYYLNSDGNGLAYETRIIKAGEEDIAKVVMEELLKGPTSKELKRAAPEGTALIKMVKDGTLVTVNLTNKFTEATNVLAVLARYSIVNTLCEIDGIQKVRIQVEGEDLYNESFEPIEALGKDDVLFDLDTEPVDIQYTTVYFSDENAMGLTAEKRQTKSNSKESLEYQIVKELIKGPVNKKLSKTVPSETKIISVETKNGICFVNLSPEFISKHWGGSSGELLTIYSIVNSLTELSTVNKVQFLIDGQKQDVFIHSVFNEPFVRNEEMISRP